MSNRTNIYKFLYLQEGDKWYPGHDYENMLTVENQLQELYKIVGTGVKSGWEVTKLSDERTDQINLLDGYLDNPSGELGQRFINMNLDFTITVKTATTANISLTGLQTIDGISLTAGQTVLVKDQTNAANNGIYTVASGAWSRNAYLDSSSDYNSNFLVYVESGTTNTQTLFQATTADTTFVLGTSLLYFYDAFLQCVKVSSGSGIVGTFAAKTDNTNYFRLTNENEYYVWATPGLILQSDGICSITIPSEPDDEYDTYTTATFLASVNVGIDTLTNNSLNQVLSIEYGEKRIDLNSLTGNFQEELRKSFLLHRHLGSIASPSKINLSGDTILLCENSYNNELSITSTIFIIKNEDGSLFSGDFSSYGIPRVYLNDVKLSENHYRLMLSTSIKKIYLRNSIKITDRLEIRLRNKEQSKLFIINDSGSLLSSNALDSVYYKLSDLSLLNVPQSDGTTAQVFKNLTWSENQYIAGKVYANDVLMNEKLYTINPSSGTIIFSADFFSSSSYFLDEIYVVIEKIGIEYSSLLDSINTQDISAESLKNAIAKERLKNISHFGEFGYKKTCSFYPSNNVISGFGNSLFFPVNVLSDLQYNFKINYIYNSNNFVKNNLLGTERGLLNSSSYSGFEFDYNFTADYDRSKFLIDNLLTSENLNYFNSTYSLNKNGVVYYTTNNGKSWKKLKSTRLSNGNKNFVNSFDISTDKVSSLSSTAATNVYSSFLYAATNHGLYTAHIPENTAIQDWNWRRLENLYDSSNTALSYDFNVNVVKELSAKNTLINSGGFDTVTYDRYIYMGSSAVGSTGLYSGTIGNMIKIFSDPVIGIEWIKTGTNNVNKNNILFWTKNKAYITHTSQYVNNDTESYWNFPISSSIASSNVLAATDKNLFATYSSATTPHSLTLKNSIEDTLGTVSINNSGIGLTGLNTNFQIYSGLGISIGIGFTSAATVTTWYPVTTISDNSSLVLDTSYAGSSIANTSYVIYIKNYNFAVDDYTYSSTGASQTVLVKNQTNNVHNGVYYVDTNGSTSSSWILKRSSNIGTRPGDNVSIINGTINDESIWYLDRNLSSVSFGASSINWYITKFKIYETSSVDYQINTIVQRNADNASTNEYILGHSDGIARVIDPQLSGTGLSTIDLPWEKDVQGQVNHILSKTSTSANGSLYIASDKGLFVSSDSLWDNGDTNYWVRTENMFNENDEVSLFNSKDNSRYTDFSQYYKYQLFKFNNTQGIGTQFLFANSYQKFYATPWENTAKNESSKSPDVTVYINNVPSTVPYFTDSNTGLINFTSSLKVADYENVKVSISRNNAYLSNFGANPHEEEVVFDNRGDVPVALLVNDNTVFSDKLYVNAKIDSTTKLLLLDNDDTHEVIYVKSINNSTFPYEISLFAPRSSYNSSTTFLASTKVFKLSNIIRSSIQDKIYKIKSKLSYNFDSLNNVNHLQILLGAKANFPYLFDFAAPVVSQTDTRGLQKIVSTIDFVNDTSLFSPEYSIITSSASQEPTFEKEPLFITNILDPSKTGSTCKIATDKGIWEYSSGNWRLEDNLGETSKIYFLKQRFDNTYIAGTNEGLYTGASGIWTSSSIFREKIYDFSEGIFNGMNYEAYAKSNGFAFNVSSIGSSVFTSDEFKTVSGQKVFGIFKGSYSKPSSQTSASEINDAIYLFTDTNIYGVTTGTVGGELSSILVGKEMLLSIPNGITEFYKGFEALPISFSNTNKSFAKHLFVLTNSGVLKIDNWNICDVTNSENYFNISDHFLPGTQCYSYATSGDTTSYPSVSKVFIGTNKGLFRSFDAGNTFEPSNRFNNEILSVFDVKIFSSTYASVTKDVILAATSKGLWYSVDDGDNWQKSGDNDSDGNLYCEANSMPSYYDNLSTSIASNGYVAQRFLGNGLVDKIYVRLKVNDLSSNSGYQSSLTNNVISAYIYTDGGSNTPSISPAAISTTTYAPADIIDKEYVYFNFNYTTTASTPYYIVIKEVKSSIALVSWMKSSELSTLSYNSLQSTNGTSWTNLSKKYFYKIVYSSSINENDTIVPVGNYDGTLVGWDSGSQRGTIVNDSGELQLIPKLLVSFAVDDTYSMSLVDSVIHKTQLNNLWLSLSNYGYSSSYYTTFADVWTINDKISQQTSGHVSDQTTISNVFSSLKLSGKKYEYFDLVSLAMNGMNPQSIIDAIIKENDEDNNVIRCEAVKDYLVAINSLRLADLITRYDNEAKDSSWNQTAATISTNAFARLYMVERFASTYIPVLFCLTDGDNSSDTTIDDLTRKAEISWNNLGAKVITIYNSDTANQKYLNDLSYQSGGQVYVSTSNLSWTSLIADLAPLAVNSLYSGYWNKSYEFIDKKYIKTVNTTFYVPLNSSCSVKFRYSTDYKNYSSWIQLSSGTPYELNMLVTNIDYSIEMSQGFLSIAYYPSVQTLYHVESEPNTYYLYSQELSTNKNINEYVLTSNIESFDNLKFEWGICRGDSVYWNDYQTILNGRNGILPNRQKSIQFTPIVDEQNLSTNTTDYFSYNVYKNNIIFTWDSSSTVTVYANGVLVNANDYRYNEFTGNILFEKIRSSTDVITVNIYTAEILYFNAGENTTTSDNQIYFLSNGTWPVDSQIVVLINNEIVRGYYQEDRSSGAILFDYKLQDLDIVTVFVLPSFSFRIAAKVSLYDSVDDYVLLSGLKFGLEYTEIDNEDTALQFSSTVIPEISDNQLRILSSGKSVNDIRSIHERMYIDYEFSSTQNNKEIDSIIKWYRTRSSSTSEVTEYYKKYVEGLVSLDEADSIFLTGDEVFAELEPSDGFKFGNTITSNTVELTNNNSPVISNPLIKSDANIINNAIIKNNALVASYTYLDVDSNNDESIVKWYEWKNGKSLLYTGATLPASYVTSSSVISFEVIPYNGVVYGLSLWSQYVYVV